MATPRLDVRLDPEHLRRLRIVAEAQGAPLSDVVRTWIDQAYEAAMRERRKQAVDQICSAEVEDVPDPAELSRQLAAKYAFERAD